MYRCVCGVRNSETTILPVIEERLALDDGQVSQEVEGQDGLRAQNLDGASYHLDLTEVLFKFLSDTIYTSVQYRADSTGWFNVLAYAKLPHAHINE